ncbi:MULTISPECIES: serine hydrolase domain-containing protein [Kitasatospora]|uniref:serine hydrolase domain-containing protein n=1 Tax=Kitasatospora cystarginea TaxID=58350 RepID=UPI0031DA5CE1
MNGSRRRICLAGLVVAALLAGAGCSPVDPEAVAPDTGTPNVGSASASAPDTGSASTSGSPPVQLSPAVTAQLDAAVGQVMQKANVPGVIVGLSIPGNGTYTKAFGVADRSSNTPMTTDLNMRIGSVTKTFTVTALLRLVDAGKVGLDDPVGKYVSGVPGGDRISLRQLADMRSGLYPYSSDQDFVNALIGNPARSFTPQELLAYSFRHPVAFEPGSQYQYSNTNTILLGMVVEKAAGQPLQDYLQQQVFVPAGLQRTVFPTDASFPDPHAHGYTNQTPAGSSADATDWNPSWAWAAGAVISNLTDMQHWAALLATGSLLNPGTQTQRLQTLPTGYPNTGYGLGLFTDNGWVGHNGSIPGYQSLVLYLPSARASLVVLSNTDANYQGSENSTLFGEEITRIVTPGNVYSLPAMPTVTTSPSASGASAPPSASQSSSGSPTGSPSGPPTGSPSGPPSGPAGTSASSSAVPPSAVPSGVPSVTSPFASVTGLPGAGAS